MRFKTIAAIVLLLCILCQSACSNQSADLQPTPHLRLSAIALEDYEVRKFTSTDLNDRYSGTIHYFYFDTVSIDLDGTDLDLPEAIKNGDITVEALIGLAMLDAKNGFCKESYESENGLNYFIYSYPEYRLEYVNDVYETPDGKKHIIRGLTIKRPDVNTTDRFYPVEGNIHESIDREDWGLTVQIKEVTPERITLTLDQTGGQQFGKLYIGDIDLYSEPLDKWISHGTDPIGFVYLTMEGTSEYTLDWETYYGTLPAGHYAFKIYVFDDYDPEDVHPLCRNFADCQSYIVHFDIE